MTAISTTPRFGLAAGSTRGLLGKILLLGDRRRDRGRGGHPARRQPGVVLADRRWSWSPWPSSSSTCSRGTSRSSTSSPARSSWSPSRSSRSCPRSACRSRTSVTAIAAPRTTRSRRSKDRRSSRSPGSAEYVLTIATEGDAATGNLSLPALRPDAPRPSRSGTPDGLTPCTDCTDEPDGQGQVRRRPDGAEPRPGGGAVGGRPGVQRSHRQRRDQGLRGEQGLRGHRRPRPTTRPATASPTPRPGRSTPPTTRGAASSTPRPATALPQGWQVNVGLATTPGRSPTRPSRGRSSASSAGTSRSRSSPSSRPSWPGCSWRSP